MSGLNRLSATAAARKLATREITAEALLADCLERIAEREPEVRATMAASPAVTMSPRGSCESEEQRLSRCVSMDEHKRGSNQRETSR